MTIDRQVGVRVVTVGELLGEDLRIPAYQRPYSWTPATALQLLDDIVKAAKSRDLDAGAATYVLGSVILHNDAATGHLNVVDGQQRLLTLLLLDRILAAAPVVPSDSTTVSPAPIMRVQRALERRSRDIANPREILRFLRENCQLIRVQTDDPDEAFRVFDSQNYRGKGLLPHDLLKAYHLRQMRELSPVMQAAVVDSWQNAPEEELDRLFSTYLWRIHRWSRGLRAPTFAAGHIDAFKGFTVGGTETPSDKYHLAAQTLGELIQTVDAYTSERDLNRRRFQLGAPILAGRTFFEMVDFMRAELTALRIEGFDDERWEEFASSSRDEGDTEPRFHETSAKSRYRYVNELYIASLLAWTNRFGDGWTAEAKPLLFAWAYQLRTRLSRVQYVSIDNHARAIVEPASAFSLMRNAEKPAEIRTLTTELGTESASHEHRLLALLQDLVN